MTSDILQLRRNHLKSLRGNKKVVAKVTNCFDDIFIVVCFLVEEVDYINAGPRRFLSWNTSEFNGL